MNKPMGRGSNDATAFLSLLEAVVVGLVKLPKFTGRYCALTAWSEIRIKSSAVYSENLK